MSHFMTGMEQKVSTNLMAPTWVLPELFYRICI